MATKQKAMINFSRMKDEEFLLRGETIVNAMDGNANYLTPTPTLADISDLLADFRIKLAAARKRGAPEDTALKNESRKPLADALRHLGYYVNTVAEGTLSILLSSGFPVSSKPKSQLVPLPVEGLRLSDGRQSGQVRLDFKHQADVLLYEYRFRRLDGDGADWSERYSTTSSRINIIAPLEVGVRYEVVVRAVNTQGPGDWGQSAEIMVR